MARPRDLIQGEPNRNRLSGGGNGIFTGHIAETATDPTDHVQVVVDAFSREKWWGPCGFMPRVDDAGDLVLPSRGDPCIVALAESRDVGMPRPVIVWWEPD